MLCLCFPRISAHTDNNFLLESRMHLIAETYTHFSESGSTAPNCILLLATSKGYLARGNTMQCISNSRQSNSSLYWIIIIIITISHWNQHLRYCLRDGTGNPPTKQVYMGFKNKDIGVVWGRAAQQLWEMLQAEALEGAVGEEGETCGLKVVGEKQSNLVHTKNTGYMRPVITLRRHHTSDQNELRTYLRRGPFQWVLE